MLEKKLTMKKHQQDLNQLTILELNKKKNGGKIRNNAKYGNWLRKNDKMAFKLSYEFTKNKINVLNASTSLMDLIDIKIFN